MTTKDNQTALLAIKRTLIKAHNELTVVTDFLESRLTTEKEFAYCQVYGAVCRTLGILEEQITSRSS